MFYTWGRVLLWNACVYLSNLPVMLSPSMTVQVGNPSIFLAFSSCWIEEKETNITWFVSLISSNQKGEWERSFVFLSMLSSIKAQLSKVQSPPLIHVEKDTFHRVQWVSASVHSFLSSHFASRRMGWQCITEKSMFGSIRWDTAWYKSCDQLRVVSKVALFKWHGK